MTDPDVTAWTRAAADPAVSSALDALEADLARAIAERGPVCWASGRCCNFDRAGHRLYATGLETARTLLRLAPALSPPPRPAPLVVIGAAPAPRPLTDAALDDAIARGTCPFQAQNLCSVHAIRPLGCRVYFCDRSAQTWQNDLYEGAMSRLRAIHDEHGVPYHYGEWRAMLRRFLDAGAIR